MIKSKEKSEILGAVVKKCLHCGGILGVCTNTVFYMGAGKFKKSITFDCAMCEKTNFWRPAEEKFKDNK